MLINSMYILHISIYVYRANTFHRLVYIRCCESCIFCVSVRIDRTLCAARIFNTNDVYERILYVYMVLNVLSSIFISLIYYVHFVDAGACALPHFNALVHNIHIIRCHVRFISTRSSVRRSSTPKSMCVFVIRIHTLNIKTKHIIQYIIYNYIYTIYQHTYRHTYDGRTSRVLCILFRTEMTAIGIIKSYKTISPKRFKLKERKRARAYKILFRISPHPCVCVCDYLFLYIQIVFRLCRRRACGCDAGWNFYFVRV